MRRRSCWTICYRRIVFHVMEIIFFSVAVCNVTISQQTIFSESKSSVGQIKSPSLQGPALCWYLLQPDPGHRLELQIYRLVNVGRFNGTG